MSTPSSRNTLSYATAPEIVTWLTFGVLLVSPGASSAMSEGDRPVGSAAISAARRFEPPPRRVSSDGDAAVTVTASITAAGRSVTSSRSIEPRLTRTGLVTAWKPSSSTRNT